MRGAAQVLGARLEEEGQGGLGQDVPHPGPDPVHPEDAVRLGVGEDLNKPLRLPMARARPEAE